MKYNDNNLIAVKSFQFAVRMMNLYRILKTERKEFIASKQLVRSGTSIGANVREAVRAQSKLDFLSKMSIASKEAAESEYWIDLLHAAGYLNDIELKSLKDDCVELIKILVSITSSTKESLSSKH